jgi:hypothetical protein
MTKPERLATSKKSALARPEKVIPGVRCSGKIICRSPTKIKENED